MKILNLAEILYTAGGDSSSNHQTERASGEFDQIEQDLTADLRAIRSPSRIPAPVEEIIIGKSGRQLGCGKRVRRDNSRT